MLTIQHMARPITLLHQALATEATLNAIQRTYPQIYKSTERLLVDPSTIRVIPKDFMISVKSEDRFLLFISSSFDQ